MGRSLVVVDMQPKFTGSERVLPQVLELVSSFHRKNLPIFIVEYRGHGETFDTITGPLQDYNQHYFTRKGSQDGSVGVTHICKALNQEPEIFEVCGVYRDACVFSTVKGLLEKFPKAEAHVHKNACYEYAEYPPHPCWDSQDRVKWV